MTVHCGCKMSCHLKRLINKNKHTGPHINETQTGFMKGRHISCNTRLALGLVDYAESIDSDAIILFLDFCKAFDTVEHRFLFASLEMFGFGSNFISAIKMLNKDINSSIINYHNTSKRFCIHRGVRQWCPISPFLFILVVALMSISILNNTLMQGKSIFNKEIKACWWHYTVSER